MLSLLVRATGQRAALGASEDVEASPSKKNALYLEHPRIENTTSTHHVFTLRWVRENEGRPAGEERGEGGSKVCLGRCY